MKSSKEIARMASELMEALEEYISMSDREIIQSLKTRIKPSVDAEVRNLFAELYGPMIKWKFEVEKLSRERL